MNHATQTIADRLLEAMEDADYEQIIQRALNEEKLTGIELHRSLVASGTALGADRVANLTIETLNRQIKVLRDTIAQIDIRVAAAAGDDTLIDFGQSIRSAIVEEITKHMNMVLAQNAQNNETVYAMPRDLFLSELPIEHMPEADLTRAGAAASFRHMLGFYGFLMTDDPAGMKCPCIGCLTNNLHKSGLPPPSKILAHGVEKYGTLDKAFADFARLILRRERGITAEFIAEYGVAENVTSAQASSATSNFLSRLISGSADDEHGE